MNSIRLMFYLSVALCTSNTLPLPEGSIEIEDEDYPEYRLGVRYDEYPVSTQKCYTVFLEIYKNFLYTSLIAGYKNHIGTKSKSFVISIFNFSCTDSLELLVEGTEKYSSDTYIYTNKYDETKNDYKRFSSP